MSRSASIERENDRTDGNLVFEERGRDQGLVADDALVIEAASAEHRQQRLTNSQSGRALTRRGRSWRS
jgi:hypothetical protein